MVECHLAKVDVAGSNPVSRSKSGPWPPPQAPQGPFFFYNPSRKRRDGRYLASNAPLWCRSCSRPSITSIAMTSNRIRLSVSPCLAA